MISNEADAVELPAAEDDPRVLRAVEEYLAARLAGTVPDRQAFLARHAEIAAALADCLDGLDFIQQAGVPLGSSDEAIVPSTAASPGAPLGDFHIVREVGRGGMGVVYEAEQISLGRRVALKVLPFASTLDSRQLQRFKNEAQAAAHLHHQHIVPVYATGCERGVHYYVMQYIDGQTLAGVITELRSLAEEAHGGERTPCCSQEVKALLTEPWAARDEEAPNGATEAGTVPPPTTLVPPTTTAQAGFLTGQSIQSAAFIRMAARLGVQAAEALEHAHHLGVVHRDVKPANLLVDGRGHVWVTDFGLAHCQGQVGLTMSGDLVGTLRYMSPEQALAQRGVIDHRSDVYSLGVTLYELLTLQPAFDGQDRQEVLRQIAFEEPRPPRRIHRAIPAELETIVLKAMAKSPAERYATAQEMADDLQRFLDDKPIRARRATLIQKIRKWTRRHPGVVATATAALIVLVLALAVSNVLISWEKNQKADALRDKETALQLAQANFEEADRQKKSAQKQEGIAEAEAKRAREQERLARRRLYATQMNLAYQAWEAGQSPRVLALLEGQRPKFGQEDLRSFEWYYLWRRLHQQQRLILRGHKGAILTLAFSPDGKTLASGDSLGIVKLWDVASGAECATLVRGSSGGGELAFSPDGKILAYSGGGAGGATVTLWEVATGRQLTGLEGSGSSLSFSPDGKTLAMATDETVRLWDVASRQQRGTLRAPPGPVLSLDFSPDGKTLATVSGWGSEDGGIVLWDLTTKPVRPRLKLQGLGAYRVKFSPDGKLLATGAWNFIRTYDVVTGQEKASFRGHIGRVSLLAFSSDGRTLTSAAQDRTVRLWDVRTRHERGSLARPARVSSLALSPDGKTFASAGQDGVVRLWDLEPPTERTTVQHYPDRAGFVALSPDSKLLISGGGSEVKLWDVTTGQARGILAIQSMFLAISPDGKLLASRDDAGVKLWDVATGQRRATIPGKGGTGLAFSTDGKTLAMDSPDGTLQLWDVASRCIRAVLAPRAPLSVDRVAFSPDGRHLAVGDKWGAVQLWDTTGKPGFTLPLEGPEGWAKVAYSPDGKILATGYDGGSVKLWDTATGQLRASLNGHTDGIDSLVFFPDGQTLATGSRDSTIRLWDVVTGQERATLKEHKDSVFALAVAPDGVLLASGSFDGTVKLWRAATDAEATARKTDLDPDDPDSPVAHNNHGDRLGAAGRLNEAVAAYQQARERLEKLVAALPKEPAYRQELTRSYRQLARIYAYRGQLEKVLAELSRVKALRLEDAEVDQALRGALWRLAAFPDPAARSPEQMVELAQQAARALPRDGDVRLALGVAQYRAGHYPAALESFEQARTLRNGGDCADWLFLAMVHWRLGNKDEARQWYDRAARSMADHPQEALHSFRAEAARLLDLPRLELFRSIPYEVPAAPWTINVLGVVFTPDSRRVLATGDGNDLRLFEVDSGQEIRRFTGHTHWVCALALSADGCLALSGGHDKTLRLWSMQTGKEVRQFPGHTAVVRFAAFSPDGKRALSGDDAVIRLWDVATGTLVHCLTGHKGAVHHAVFSPDGREVFSAGADRTIRVWNVASGREVRQFEQPGMTSFICVSRDGKTALSAGPEDASPRLWDVAAGKRLRRLQGSSNSKDPPHEVVFSPDGRLAISAHDRKVRLWDLREGKELYLIEREGLHPNHVAISPDGRWVAAANWRGSVSLWRLTDPRSHGQQDEKTGDQSP
jgi:WD40 repeat protein/serine/threonine protein kinase